MSQRGRATTKKKKPRAKSRSRKEYAKFLFAILHALASLPRHLRLAIDAVFSHAQFKNHVERENVAIIAHSVGGYTALALAGGIPPTQSLVKLCQKPASADEPYWLNPLRKDDITSQPIAVTADDRVKALVLLAPDVSLFMSEGALQNVRAPILLLVAEKDYMPRETIAVMCTGIRDRSQLTRRVVENAGHYSFLSPFPEAIKSRVGDAAKDPDGFDRERFHHELQAEVLGFLRKALAVEGDESSGSKL